MAMVILPRDCSPGGYLSADTITTNFSYTTLGLSLSYDIVREHGGGIIPESRHGDYTEMTVILPHTKKADADYDVGKTDS